MNTIFTIAIVGRPNVGKSALFNRVIRKRKAIIEDLEGVTRDRIYETVEVFGKTVRFIDTGGIDHRDTILFSKEIREQTYLALKEADAVILVLDGKAGITIQDEEVARLLLKQKKDVVLAVNKLDNEDLEREISEYYTLGIPEVFPVSAIHGSGVADLLQRVTRDAPEDETVSSEEEEFDLEEAFADEEENDEEEEIEEELEEIEYEEPPLKEEVVSFPKVAIVGRTNVGKSTLINTLFGEERCLVSDIAGTTRDAIDVMVDDILFIDTAGIRKKKAEKESVDKFAGIRTQKAIERADICILVIDVHEGLTSYEKAILQIVEEAGKGCILFLNKWDLVKDFRMEHAVLSIRGSNAFLAHVPILVGSAKTGRNVDKIFDAIREVWIGCRKRVSTGSLNTFLEGAIQRNYPPILQGKRFRVYYLTQYAARPPSFILFVNDAKLLIESYRRYLINQMRETYGFTGAPIRFKVQTKSQKRVPVKKKKSLNY